MFPCIFVDLRKVIIFNVYTIVFKFRLFWKIASTLQLCKECHGPCCPPLKSKDIIDHLANLLPITIHHLQLALKFVIYLPSELLVKMMLRNWFLKLGYVWPITLLNSISQSSCLFFIFSLYYHIILHVHLHTIYNGLKHTQNLNPVQADRKAIKKISGKKCDSTSITWWVIPRGNNASSGQGNLNIYWAYFQWI